jgi:hypothetical protein
MDREAMKQPEALRLADVLDDEFTQGRISNHNGRKAAVELRRLHEVNQDLLKGLHEALETDLARVGEVGVWVECEPQEALEDGWCDWICPKPQGYLMQCCDCELIHEVDFRVVQYEPRPSEVYEVVDDPNLQAQMRLRRRDDLSPKREWVGLTDEELEEMHNEIKVRLMGTYRTEDIYRSIEAKLKEKNHG